MFAFKGEHPFVYHGKREKRGVIHQAANGEPRPVPLEFGRGRLKIGGHARQFAPSTRAKQAQLI